MIKALSLLRLIAMSSDNNIRKYELDEVRGIAKADDPEDHNRLMEAIKALTELRKTGTSGVVAQSPAIVQNPSKNGLKLPDLVDKFFQLKKQLKPSTVLAYKNTAKEFAQFLSNPVVNDIGISDITRYQEFIAKTNSPRTIDNKIATLRTLFYFAIKQGYYFNDNPAVGRTIMSKTDKAKSGYEIFEDQEILKIYQSENFIKEKEVDPDFYWCLMLGLFTGCRISEITSLKSDQILVSDRGVNFIRIRESKTLAGVRDIPVTQKLFDLGFADFIKNKDQIFKYPTRLGKGSGNAVGKKFKRLLEDLNITREKLVFHSLRKFTNDLFMKEGVPFEPRCQFFGHEIENVNVATYSKKFSVDQLAEIISSANQKLMMMSGVLKTKF
ncbi:phage integrase SAM-like domain-containing protein [Burkholderia vietnamiensis]|uniref:phage integrase SAM-like domain-containing protein n=1 Tax=Burkholderia vietnamiensis TaxID=60552 RepID=UPI001B95A559|nr:phage integrase SAM-like domain-containing protein [Burkholderia vietnamiensis]MBR8150493.1 phage integrase N-terminal SAM-like domain-containing protein [Burkholderia vietnamiensis]